MGLCTLPECRQRADNSYITRTSPCHCFELMTALLSCCSRLFVTSTGWISKLQERLRRLKYCHASFQTHKLFYYSIKQNLKKKLKRTGELVLLSFRSSHCGEFVLNTGSFSQICLDAPNHLRGPGCKVGPLREHATEGSQRLVWGKSHLRITAKFKMLILWKSVLVVWKHKRTKGGSEFWEGS